MPDTIAIAVVEDDWVALPVADKFLYTNRSSRPQVIVVSASKPAVIDREPLGHTLSRNSSLTTLSKGETHWVFSLVDDATGGAFTESV